MALNTTQRKKSEITISENGGPHTLIPIYKKKGHIPFKNIW